MALLLKQDCWNGTARGERLVVDEGEDQEQMLADRQESERRLEFLKKALDSLPDQERQIIDERHLRDQATPLKDLGARFGVSGESIRQMELKALKAMKGMAPLEQARRHSPRVTARSPHARPGRLCSPRSENRRGSIAVEGRAC